MDSRAVTSSMRLRRTGFGSQRSEKKASPLPVRSVSHELSFCSCQLKKTKTNVCALVESLADVEGKPLVLGVSQGTLQLIMMKSTWSQLQVFMLGLNPFDSIFQVLTYKLAVIDLVQTN